MTVVADSGPLIAFAKIGGLETLLGVYPRILTPRAVFEESVNEVSTSSGAGACFMKALSEQKRIRKEQVRGQMGLA